MSFPHAKNIQDDIQIIGRSNSLLSQIKKPLNKQLQLEGTVNFVSVDDGLGNHAGGITIDGIDISSFYGTPRQLTANDQTETLTVSDYHVEATGVATKDMTILLPKISTLGANKEYSIIVKGHVSAADSTISVVSHGKDVINTDGDTIDGHGIVGAGGGGGTWHDNWINFYHTGSVIIRAIVGKNPGLGSEDGWTIISSTNFPSKDTYKGQVRVASSADVDLSTIVVGGTVDGETILDGDKILLKEQTDPIENGIYHFYSDEPIARSHELSIDTSAAGHSVGILAGTHIGKTFRCTAVHGSDTVATDALVYTSNVITTGLTGVGVNEDVNIYPTTTGGDIVVGTGLVGGDILMSDSGATGAVKVLSAVDSTTTGTGALIVSGGLAVVKDTFLGADLNFSEPAVIVGDTVTDAVSLFDTTTTGNVTVGAALTTGNVTLGNESTGTLIIDQLSTHFTPPPILVADTVADAVSLFDTTTTGQITAGALLTTADISLSNASATGAVKVLSVVESTSTSTGALIVDGGLGVKKDLFCDGSINLINDNERITWGAGSDFHIEHDSANTNLVNTTGALQLNNTAVTGRIICNLGTATDATSFQVRDSALAILFKVDGAGGFEVPQKTAFSQPTSVTQGFTHNSPRGIITTFTQTLASHATVTFIWTNSFIAADSMVIIQPQYNGTSGGEPYLGSVDPAGGSVTIKINNGGGVTMDAVVLLHFWILT